MQTSGVPNHVHLSSDTAKLLEGKFKLEARGTIAFKGMNRVHTFLLGPRIK
jgi:hypothetical protein